MSDYNAFWRCIQAGATYLFVQLCKMLFLTTFFPTWEGGTGMSVNSSISLVHYITMAALVWMFTCYYLPKHYQLPLTFLLGIGVYKAFFMESFVHVFLLGSWTALLVKAVITGLLSLSSLTLFITLVHSN
uniref:BOS complex subunit TMEM147 n=1 Tax=Anolis carolinensis TaxID=28377 RepID=A0A803TL46_ANOCA